MELAQPYQARQFGYPDPSRNVCINKLFDASQLQCSQTSANRIRLRVLWVRGVPQFPQNQQPERLRICMVIYTRPIYDALEFLERRFKIAILEVQRWRNF